MMPIDTVRHTLEAHGCRPKPSGDGYSACCPAHEDRNPSLSLSEGDGGRALIHCHAGCSVEDVVGALGLRMTDLFEGKDSQPGYRAAPRRAEPQSSARHRARAKAFSSAEDAIAYHSNRFSCQPSRRWAYHNAECEVVGYKVRWDPEGGKKQYRPVALIDGAWHGAGMPEPRPLYGLPALADAHTIVVVEGEKCADVAKACGFIATTSAHGAESPEKSNWTTLAGKDVVILPDNHAPGMRYAETVADLCARGGASSMRIVDLAEHWPDLPEGGDIADALELEGGDADEVKRAIEALAVKADPIPIESPELTGALDGYRPFPVDVLPEPLRAFVCEAAQAIDCDESFVALPMLSGLAAAIGNSHVAVIKRGYTAPAILWTAIVGESGTAKSPALKAALKAIQSIEDRAHREHNENLKAWEPEHLMWQAGREKWKKNPSAGPPQDEPERPICSRYIASDTTVEALATLLRDNPRGLLVATDELASWFGGFDRYSNNKGGDAPKWLSMYDGASLTVDRKGSGSLRVPKASVSLTGGIQPGTLRTVLGTKNVENGLAARVLFAHPPRRARRHTDAVIAVETDRALAEVFERLIALESETDTDDAPPPRAVPLSGEAMELWRRFVEEFGAEQMEHTGAAASVFSKLESVAARLALVFQLVKSTGVATVAVAAASSDKPGVAGVAVATTSVEIDTSSLSAGIALARWFAHEAMRMLELLDESESEEEIRSLIDWIKRKGGSASVRDLSLGPRNYRKGGRCDPENALNELVKRGLADWEENARRRVCVLRSAAGGNGYTGNSGNTSAGDRLAPSRTVTHTDTKKAG